MTNEEFYKDELKEIMHEVLIDALAVDKNGKIRTCDGTPCSGCMFDARDCQSNIREWLKQEHVEPEQQVDWSKVKVDTPIYVREPQDEEWKPRYFAKYENGRVYAWIDRGTSFSKEDVLEWNHAKLAESEEK